VLRASVSRPGAGCAHLVSAQPAVDRHWGGPPTALRLRRGAQTLVGIVP